MKHTLLTASLVMLCLNLVSCGKGGNQDSSTPVKSAQSEKLESPSETEKNFASQLSFCKQIWDGMTENLEQEEEVIVAMGIVGKECLNIEKVSSYKKVLASYLSARNGEEVNWIELSKAIIKMESI